MKTYQTNVHQTQGRIGFARPPVYSLPEVGAEVGLTTPELVALIKKHSIKPALALKRPWKYHLGDFQKALNETKGTEFVIERGVSIPRVHKVSERWAPVLASMDVGDSIVLSDDDCTALVIAVRRDYPKVKLVTRKAEAAGTRRVWRIA